MVGFGEVGDFHVGGVPFDAGIHARGDVAEQADFRERRGVAEVRAGLRAGFAGVDPVHFVRAFDARQGFRRAFEFLHFAFGKQPRAAAVNAAGELAFVALENDAATVFAQVRAVLGFRRARRPRAFIPVHLHRRQISARGKTEGDDGRQRMNFLGHAARSRLDARGRTELERGDDGIERVRAAVAHHAVAEIPPATPHAGMIGRMVGTFRRRAEPQVPVQFVRQRLNVFGTTAAATPFGTPARVTPRVIGKTAPGIHLAHLADCARRNPFTDEPGAFAAVALDSHLRGDF
ncbi:MAG: hypothetical protein NTZ16_02480 [Verrucomicrobia bacterium]|nr:hypothetical protein [Verrucomicrobiota bacterium]